ncbi:uncharacterized protein [Nicotiana sylvestris]|uniref:uncharacterized protein n=1 Tax=Nicotiana sylvestris TaxID=4096 RepID=UPI00388C911F
MEDILKIKQGYSELLREFMDRFQRERMMLPRVPENWSAMAFASNLNEKSSEATRQLKESLREFPATTWNDVYNRYNTKLKIEEYTISQSQKEEKVSSRRAETKKSFDQLIDATAGHELSSFLDAYSRYNQIKMDPLDEEKASFIKDKGTYCCKIMPFGLKNAGATYQRLVTKMFQEHLGKTMEVYIDDILVKSQQSGDHISHLFDTFHILQKFNMKLNPKKCAFGVSSGKFLGFLVSNRGIEVNLAQIKAIEEIPDMLTNNKEVLADCLADFSHGIQFAAEKEQQVFNGCNPGIWTLFTDGSSNVKGAGLELARELGINHIVIKSDSQLVVNQMLGTYTIPRDENVEADALANLASAADVTSNENASVIHLFHSVLDPDKNEYGTVPEDKKKALALRKKATRYCLKQGNLYRKMFGGPLARCLGPSTKYVMREIHEGHCGNHAGGRSLIKRITSTPYHLVGNEQVESTNKVIINNLKKRLEESKGNWPELLLGVLWAYRTTAKTSTGETPFSLVYGAEALILVEIGEPSTRYTQASEESNEEEMRINLDLLEGKREVALIKMATQKQVIERYYNRKARLDTSRLRTSYSRKFFNPRRQLMREN